MAPLSDRRRAPRISPAAVVKAARGLFWARLGSLTAWALVAGARCGERGLHEPPGSADSLGRIHARRNAEALRHGIHHVDERLKRNKALPDLQGVGVAALDGHESHARYPASLCGVLEPQRPGDDEVDTALRVLARVLAAYPRAFDVGLGDGLDAQAPVFTSLRAHRKHALVVRKDERRNLSQDGAGLFARAAPHPGRYRARACWGRDVPAVDSWPQAKAPVRVIRSRETYAVRRQLDPQDEPQTSDWIWAATLPPPQVPVDRVVRFGHQRWDIENSGFTALVNDWHSDHVFSVVPSWDLLSGSPAVVCPHHAATRILAPRTAMRISPTRLTHPKPRKTRKLLRPLRVRCGIAVGARFLLTKGCLTHILLSMRPRRVTLLRRLVQAAEAMLQGSFSQTTRTCGNPTCRCHRGQRHGPHTYLTFKTSEGRSSAVYVPAECLPDAQTGVAAWNDFWELAVALAAENRERAVARWRAGRWPRRRGAAPRR